MMDMAEHDRQEAEAREAAAPKVVGLHGQPVAAVEPSQDVVELLRNFLAAAERGEVVALSIVAVMPNGSTRLAWQYGGPGTDYGLCGAMDLAKAQMICGMLEHSRPI
jgi:hypothetical protein